MHVGIVGSRNYPDLLFVENYVRKICQKYGKDTTIVSGHGAGVDRAAEDAAIILDMPISIKYPKCASGCSKYEFVQAAFARNTEIAQESYILIAFHNYRSSTHGTLDTVYKAVQMNKAVFLYDQGKRLWTVDQDQYTIQAYLEWNANFGTYKGPLLD